MMKRKKWRMMITKINDEVIDRLFDRDIIIFTSFVDGRKERINFHETAIKLNDKVVHPRNAWLGWSYRELKKYLRDLLTVGTLEWENND